MVTGCSCGGVYFFKPRGGRIIEGHNSFDLANRSHNSGSGFVSIGSIAASGDFVQTNTCSSSLNPNGKCNISVSFRPTAIGSRSGVLKITDNAARSPQRIPLTGTGLKSPQASLSSSSLSFASQSVGTVSVAQAVTVSNTGTAPLVFSRIAASGDFIQSNTCGSSLAIGASCAISVSFQPGAIGTRTGALKIADNAPGSAQTVTLTGSGVGVPQALLAPANLSFSNQNVNRVSAAQTVTLSNTGTGTLGLSSIAASGDFVQTNSCGATLAAGGSCTISVSFQPGAIGTRTGALKIADNAPGSAQTVTLSGTGVGVPQALLSPANLSFSNQSVNTASAAQTVTLSNTGTGTLGLSSIAASGDFAQTNSCSATLAAGGSCTISVTFQPNGAGVRTGALVIADNATGSPQSVSLTGTGFSSAGAISAVWANEGGDKVAQDELRASHRTENLTGKVVNRVWDVQR